MPGPRPATFAQLYRLNRLNALTLAGIDNGQQIMVEQADAQIQEAVDTGVWTPRTDPANPKGQTSMRTRKA